jgi:hypothetical protein
MKRSRNTDHLIYTAAIATLAACSPSTFKRKIDVPVVVSDTSISGRKVLLNVGDDLANNQMVRVKRPSLAELRAWESTVEWLSYTPEQSCMRLVVYAITSERFADGQGNVFPTSDFASIPMSLETASGATYSATPTVDVQHLEIQFDSFDPAMSTWLPATSEWKRSVVDGCFATAQPLAGEAWVRWKFVDAPAYVEDWFTFTPTSVTAAKVSP